MKSLTEYIVNESSVNPDLIYKAEYCADSICIANAFIDLFKTMLIGDEITILDFMYEISGSVMEYNASVPRSITKYAQSKTNITADDWIARIKYYVFNDNKTVDEIKNIIIKDKSTDYAYFGTSFSKISLKRILDLFKEYCDDKDLKKFIANEKKIISNYKQKFNDYKKSMN